MSGKLFHAPFIAVHPGFELYSVLERSKKQVQEIYPAVKSVSSMEEILNDPEVELVVVNTPNYTHFEYASKALMAGKHVVVEKPFTVNAEEAAILIKIAEEQNRILTVYHNRRWDSDFLTVKKFLSSGMLGEVVDAEIHYDRYNPGLSYKVHKENAGPGTGVLHDLGSHLIDSAIQLFGMPDSVFADLRIIRKNSLVQDYMDILFYYSNKRVHLKSSYLVKEALPGFIIHGRKGSFFKSRSDNQEGDLLIGKIPGSANWGVESSTQKGWYNILAEGETKRAFIDSETGNYMGYYDQLYAALRKEGSVPVPAEDAWNVMRVIDAAIQSNSIHQMVSLENS
jgi:predicted dehydrogenase